MAVLAEVVNQDMTSYPPFLRVENFFIEKLNNCLFWKDTFFANYLNSNLKMIKGLSKKNDSINYIGFVDNN